MKTTLNNEGENEMKLPHGISLLGAMASVVCAIHLHSQGWQLLEAGRVYEVAVPVPAALTFSLNP